MKKLIGILLVALLVTTLLLAACAPKPAPTPSPAPAPTPAPAPSPKPAPAPSPTPAPAAKVIEWPMQSTDAETSLFTKLNREFSDRVFNKSGGQLKIVVYPSAGLGVPWDQVPFSLQNNTIPIVHIPTPFMSGKNPIFGLQSLPFLVSNLGEHQMMHSAIYEFRQQAFSEFNSFELLQHSSDPQIYCSKNPLNTPEAFKGLKVRSISPEDASFMAAMGASPITMPYSEVYTALQRGTMDAVITGYNGHIGLSIWEVGKYINNFALTLGGVSFVVSKAAFNALPTDVKLVLLEEAYHTEKLNFYAVGADKERAIGVLLSRGMQIVEPTQELRKAMAELAPKEWDKWAQKSGPVAQEALKRVRTALGK